MKKEIYVSGFKENNRVFLTSGFQPPYEGNIGEQIIISAEGQSYATGGSIQHIFLNEKLNKEEKKELIKKIFRVPIIYITLTPTKSVCNNCNYSIIGEILVCPKCGSKDILIYSRVIGYVRPIARGGKKGITINKEKGIFDGEENYWRDERRADWILREKIDKEKIDDIEEIINNY